ncbi:sulfite exporter TauE/SafE family protein [Leptolyngbya sp. FACHB-261]|nr:sulfite exporter TauE/SafE family protein [Leptolyngbya sp. FACHB-261]
MLSPALLGLLLVGTVVGVLSALLGIGGGLLMVPVLTLWGATPVQAIASSLVAVVLSSASGTYQNWRMQQLNLERVALLAPPAMLTTELGVWITTLLPPGVLLLSFALLQLLAIFLMNLKQRLQRRHPQTTDQATSSEPRIYRTQGIGLLAGLLSGLFGVGGGVVMVPLQMLFLEEGIKDAVRTSLGAVTLISIWAVGRHALAGNVLWLDGLALGIGGLCGAQFGARLLPKLPDTVVNLLFRSLLLLLALYMSAKAFIGWGWIPWPWGS